ncbi:MAG: type II toxin-antitoxin system VapC family toxin [Deltaproteobacteria bacterium]|nr:type II toxin-antitoxin system VapC family toxin [Deltaproteobacteria bacterium]
MSGAVLDSSIWLEYFVGGKHAKTCFKYIQTHKPLWTPSLVIYEVYKKICKEKSETEGLLVITQIEGQSENIISLDERLALFSADISLKHKLAMADAIIYATAIHQEAQLITRDHHFKGLDEVILV